MLHVLAPCKPKRADWLNFPINEFKIELSCYLVEHVFPRREATLTGVPESRKTSSNGLSAHVRS